MSWATVSLLMKVTRVPTGTVSVFGDTPLDVIVIVVPPGDGAGDGEGDGAGEGEGEGEGELGVLPPPHVAAASAPTTTNTINQVSRCCVTLISPCLVKCPGVLSPDGISPGSN